MSRRSEKPVRAVVIVDTSPHGFSMSRLNDIMIHIRGYRIKRVPSDDVSCDLCRAMREAYDKGLLQQDADGSFHLNENLFT